MIEKIKKIFKRVGHFLYRIFPLIYFMYFLPFLFLRTLFVNSFLFDIYIFSLMIMSFVFLWFSLHCVLHDNCE